MISPLPNRSQAVTPLFGFGKSLRLLNSLEYQHVFQAKKRAPLKYFIIYYRLNNLEHSRLGLIVSKKVSKKAVERNRIKRQIREVFRKNCYHLRSADFVIISTFRAKEKSNEDLAKDLQKIVKTNLLIDNDQC